MKNQGQCKWGLLYNEFSILLIQTFTSPEIKIPKYASDLSDYVTGDSMNVNGGLYM